jgi:DegV family protein with EDD domain
VKVAIVTDASADLPEALAAAHGVGIAPLRYILGGKVYSTGEQDTSILLTSLDRGDGCEVSGVEADDFETAYRQALDGAEHLICICHSVGSSFTRVSAEVAARQLLDDDIQVDVTSPGRSTAALAAIALAAGDAARAGQSADAVAALINDASTRADTYLLAPSLDQLDRAGQLSIVQSQSGVGRLDEGVPLFRLRGRLNAVAIADDSAAAEGLLIERIFETAGDRPVHLIATHVDAPAEAERLLAAAKERVNTALSLVTEAGPTISGLLGRGAYGLGFCALEPA